MSERVLVEFTEDTDKRAKGDRVYVDPASAKSFVEKKKVAKRVEDEKPEPVKAAPPVLPGGN